MGKIRGQRISFESQASPLSLAFLSASAVSRLPAQARHPEPVTGQPEDLRTRSSLETMSPAGPRRHLLRGPASRSLSRPPAPSTHTHCRRAPGRCPGGAHAAAPQFWSGDRSELPVNSPHSGSASSVSNQRAEERTRKAAFCQTCHPRAPARSPTALATGLTAFVSGFV